MSKVLTTLTVINHADQIRAECGTISPKQVRSVTLENVLVNTRATTLCLPADIIAQLGLEFLKQAYVETATGIEQTRIFQDATISLCGREGTLDCLELPAGRDGILGMIPLEALGIELDLINQNLKVLPTSSTDTYLTI
ncbi:hypothetical protein NIES4071_85100 [Calothrix sp. NIES-4071]|nr:hypothetical protein NIES4071_85100 [Calothrix sp. NIES-4071]BAZ62777.1 hypothetical protein NIES4105_85030 [Calothrix sp. NIES-4105]